MLYCDLLLADFRFKILHAPDDNHFFAFLPNESVKMVKPDIQITDNGLTTQTAIKEAAGLDPSDLKALTARVVQFISENEEATSKTPRAWKKPEWKELAETFMDDEDNGRTYFHHSRGNSNDEDYFFWPEDRDM